MRPSAASPAMTAGLSLPRLAEGLGRGDPPLGRYLDGVLARLDQVEPQVLSLLPEPGRPARLRREADALERQYPAGAPRPVLFGVAIGVKDIFRVDGFPTRAGSRLPPEELAGEEAEAVRRLWRAGVTVLGKTVTTEFAYFAPGPTRNPRHLEHTPGGSSSGSAAAVAAGLTPLSLGTQTIGSILRPAGFCGVVGVKPSYGRIPTDGVIPLAPSLDHIGVFTSDVAGAALAASVLCNGWSARPNAPRPTLGIPVGPYLKRAGEIARRHFDRAAAALSEAGFACHTVEVMPDFEDIAARHQTILAAEAAQVHAVWFERYADRYHGRTANLIREGQAIPAEVLATARAGQAALRQELESTMDRAGIDVWIAPATVGPAPRGLDSTGDPIMNLPWTQAGLPALSLPCGLEPDGLPLGLQLVARWNDDERLMTWARMIETTLGVLPAPAVAALGGVEGG